MSTYLFLDCQTFIYSNSQSNKCYKSILVDKNLYLFFIIFCFIIFHIIGIIVNFIKIKRKNVYVKFVISKKYRIIE